MPRLGQIPASSHINDDFQRVKEESHNEPFQNEQRPNVISLGSGVTESYKSLAGGTKQEEFDISLTGLSD